MPLHLALQILQRWALGLAIHPEELQTASETLRQTIYRACLRNTLFSSHSSSDKEEIESEIFVTLLDRLKGKDFPTEGQARSWLNISVHGFLLDQHRGKKDLFYFKDFQDDEHAEQEPEWEDTSHPDPEDELAQKQALQNFYAQREAFIESFLQTISANKREDVRRKREDVLRRMIEEMEAIHIYDTLSIDTLIQESGKSKNTIQKRHSRLRSDLQEHLQQLEGPKIPRRYKEMLFAWLAELNGKSGRKYDN